MLLKQNIGQKGFFFLILILSCYISLVSSKLNERHIHLRNEVIDTDTVKTLHPVTWVDKLALVFGNVFPWLAKNQVEVEILLAKEEEHQSYFIHFDHTLTSHDPSLEALKKKGILVGNYLPRNTYMVSAKPSQIESAKHVEGVLWIGDMEHVHKQPSETIVHGFLSHHVEKTIALHEKEYKREERLTGRKFEKIPPAPKKEEVEFVIMAHLAKHETRQHLSESVQGWEVELKKLVGDDFHRIMVVSHQKIATMVLGPESTKKVASFLSKKGLVHWVEVF
jgi:hypothetical protein